METTGTQTAPLGMPLGAEESQGSNRIFVNLRTGKIAQTSNSEIAGFKPSTTKNKDGTVNHFFAKEFDKITGYITDIRWHTHKLQDGTTLMGWNVTIDTTKEVYVLGVSSNDRPFQRFMNVCLAVDFEKPVMFVAFMGKHKVTDQPQKVLLLSQGMNPETNKPIWIQPVHEEKWLSRTIIDKLKHGDDLTEAEERNVSRNKDGSFNKEFPYIHEKIDGKWSFDNWDEFLHEQMKEFVIPNVAAANQLRGAMTHTGPASIGNDIPEEYDGPPTAPPSSDPNDDIPF